MHVRSSTSFFENNQLFISFDFVHGPLISERLMKDPSALGKSYICNIPQRALSASQSFRKHYIYSTCRPPGKKNNSITSCFFAHGWHVFFYLLTGDMFSFIFTQVTWFLLFSHRWHVFHNLVADIYPPNEYLGFSTQSH